MNIPREYMVFGPTVEIEGGEITVGAKKIRLRVEYHGRAEGLNRTSIFYKGEMGHSFKVRQTNLIGRGSLPWLDGRGASAVEHVIEKTRMGTFSVILPS